MSVMAVPPPVLGVLEAGPDEARRLLARVSRQWILDVLGDRDSARLEGVIIGLEALRRESESSGIHQLVVACFRGEEATYRRALVDAGVDPGKVASMSCKQLCRAYGIEESTAKVAGRVREAHFSTAGAACGACEQVCRYLRGCAAEVAAWLVERLLRGLTLSWIDQARRLVPPGAASAIESLEELEPLSSRELREVARGARGAGRAVGSGETPGASPGCSSSSTRLGRADACGSAPAWRC